MWIALLMMGCNLTGEMSGEPNKPAATEECPDCVQQYDNHDYYFSPAATPYQDAVEACEELGMMLVSIDDADENNWLYGTLTRFGSNQWWWLGYDDEAKEGKFQWISGSNSDYQNWGNGEPNNSGATEDCAVFGLHDATWNDAQCETPARFICEQEE